METSFGNWIKRRRKALDLTQEELSQRVGCSSSAIYKIEADERRPSRQVAELLAIHLEVPLDQQALFLKVARQEKGPGGLDDVPPLSDLMPAIISSPRQSQLPIFPTLFVGREHEIDAVVNLLQDPTCRLLTLTGPGGVGKTRLAVEVARKLESIFADGIFFFAMASVHQPESIIPVLADGLGIVFSGPADPKMQVINMLRDKNVLLIFDNMEHLIAGSAILGEVLQQSPKVKLLLTSREQVHLQWEWIFEVQGLPFPEEVSTDMLETNSAVVLLLQRARQVSPNYSLSTEEVSALVRICTYVEGLPLAIELAASWVQIMSFQEIAFELERNLDILETSKQDVPARHRSIKIVFDHSWTLLTDAERAVLRKLSVFPGGFSRQAADAVAGASLLLLSSLVGKSLLHYNKKADRYDFHELIRQHANMQLHQLAAEEQQILESHCQYFSRWLADLEAPLKSARQMVTSMQIRSETSNWLAAWHWAVQNRRYDLLRQMTPCLYWYYEIHGYYAGALSSYQFAVNELHSAGAPDNLSTPQEKATFAFLVNQYGWFQFRTGNVEQAATLFAESLEVTHDQTDQVALFHNHVNWGYLALLNGDIVEAKRLTVESLNNAKKLHSQWHIAIPITILGIIEFQQGNLAEALQQLSDSLQIWRAVGDPRGLSFCMLYLSAAALAFGDLNKVEAILQESNAIAIDKMDHWALAFGFDLLGQVAMLRKNPENARNLFRQSLALSDDIGDKWAGTQTLIHLGEAQASLQMNEDAKSLFQQAYSNAQQSKWAPTVLEALIASISIDEEIAAQTRLAITLSVLAHPAVTQQTRQRAEQLRDRFVSSLTAQQVAAAQVQAAEKHPEMWERDVFPTGERLLAK